MALEIERKFLITGDAWRAAVVRSTRYRQGYLATGSGPHPVTVRVRTSGQAAFLTVKGPSDAAGLARAEFEYPIPVPDAEQLLATLCTGPLIDKTRHLVPVDDGGGGRGNGDAGPLTWEIDEFHGVNAPLLVAEIELPSPDHPFARPSWLGHEVTADIRYRNAYLAAHPYSTWPPGDRSAQV